ncbi:hypothetical protein CBS101457_000456 [Exobasidium rhododendri]|nr:hypothetical protein CBS101457_000456 [Exobasidium rhododendri]
MVRNAACNQQASFLSSSTDVTSCTNRRSFSASARRLKPPPPSPEPAISRPLDTPLSSIPTLGKLKSNSSRPNQDYPFPSTDKNQACQTLSSSSPAAPRSQGLSNASEKGKAKETPADVDLTESKNLSAVPPEVVNKPSLGRKGSGKTFKAQKAALILSPTAIERLKALLESSGGPKLIRIGVRNKGCAGMSYHLEYISPDQAGKFDERVKQDGVEVLIESKALFSIIGSEMDWQEDRLSAKFVFHNPNIVESSQGVSVVSGGAASVSMLFSAGEKILCFHVGLLYEAKVLKAEKWLGNDNLNNDVGPHYLVHYQGWRARWDEWVPESRMLKLNEDNIIKQKALVESVKAAQEAKTKEQVAPRKSNVRDASEVTDGGDRRKAKESSRATKRGRDTVEQEDEYIKRPEIKITIHDVLKVKLVDDWENVTKKSQLVPLPRKPNVEAILQEYRLYYLGLKKESKAASRPPAVLDEILEGLTVYFNKALGNNLLYRFERAQYVQARKEWSAEESNKGAEMEASKVYGGEHLLRLFVNLPGIVAHTTMDADSILLLKDHLAELLSFLVREQKKFFVKEYETPGPSYHRLSST